MFWSKKPRIIVDDAQIDELLTRSISAIYPSKEELKNALKSGQKLKIYLGCDATAPSLHFGHATNLIFLEKIRKLGHQIVFLFGDFTAMIGDPTGKEAARVKLTKTQVDTNIKGWKDQVGKIINLKDRNNPPLFYKNSQWLSKINFEKLIEIASNFTVQQMIERDMFEKRLQDQKPIYLHEFFYPLMQGYDSVAMNVDAEVGGNDQTFNMLAGRVLQKNYNQKNKFVVTTTLLVNPKTGKKLMSKSEGGYIALNDSPQEMFGKTMALPDEVIISMFIDCTYLPMYEIKQIEAEMSRGANPKDYKVKLAKELVAMIHGVEQAESAHKNFVNTFSKKEVPEDVMQILADKGALLRDLLVQNKVVVSNADWKRLIDGQAVYQLDPEVKITDLMAKVEETHTYRVGKKRFAKVVIK